MGQFPVHTAGCRGAFVEKQQDFIGPKSGRLATLHIVGSSNGFGPCDADIFNVFVLRKPLRGCSIETKPENSHIEIMVSLRRDHLGYRFASEAQETATQTSTSRLAACFCFIGSVSFPSTEYLPML